MKRRVLLLALGAFVLVAALIASGHRSRPVPTRGDFQQFRAWYHPWPGLFFSVWVGKEGEDLASWPSRQVVLGYHSRPYVREGRIVHDRVNVSSFPVACEPTSIEQTYVGGQRPLLVIAHYGPGCPGPDSVRFYTPS